MSTFHINLLRKFEINCVDMESAPLAEIVNQTKTNFLGVKVVSHMMNIEDLIFQEQQFQDFKNLGVTK